MAGPAGPRIRKVRGGKALDEHIVRKFCVRGMYFLRPSVHIFAKLHAVKVVAAYACFPYTPSTTGSVVPSRLNS